MATSPKYLILENDTQYHELKIKEYFHDQTAYEYFTRRILPLYTPAFIGMYIGGSVGGPPSALVGGGIGIMAGAYATRQITVDGLGTWKQLNIENKVFQEYENTHRNANELFDLKCPISRCLISDPVKTPYGDYYERKSLQDLAAMHPEGKINDPLGKGSYKLSDISDAPEFIMKMKNTFKMLLYKELITEHLSDEVSKGLGLLIADLDKQIVNYVFRKTNLLLDQLHSSKITLEQYNQRVTELAKITSS